jgi:hypothetical protein
MEYPKSQRDSIKEKCILSNGWRTYGANYLSKEGKIHSLYEAYFYFTQEKGTLDRKIAMLGDRFRGLWATRRFAEDPDKIEMRWMMTVFYKGDFVESPDFATSNEALDWAIKTFPTLREKTE